MQCAIVGAMGVTLDVEDYNDIRDVLASGGPPNRSAARRGTNSLDMS